MENITAATSPSVDDVRSFWDARPCNVRHSKLPVGSRAYCMEVRQRRYFVEPHIPAFADFTRWKGKTVLEIGVGIGTDSAMFAENGAQVTGIELSDESLKICKECFASLGLQGEFYVADGESFSRVVPIQSFDLVYSFGVIHHSPHPDKIIEEITKYMGPESELRIMLYAKFSWKSFLIFLRLDQPEAQYGCPIAFTYSAHDVRKLLKDYEIISITKDHIFPYRITEYKDHKYRKTFLWSIVPEFLAKIMRRHLGWHLLIRARLKR